MEIITKLTTLASALENKGLMALASDVDGATALFVKVAKELGGQGYWVQNGRCWQGCYRSKRASKPKTSAQDIWFECQEEYEKAIAGNSDDWNKYAGVDDVVVKTAEAQKFASTINTLVAEGEDIGTAVFSTISTNIADVRRLAIDAADSLSEVSDKLASTDIKLATEAAELSAAMVKEAWGLGGLGNVVAPAINKMRGLGKGKANLTNVMTLLNQLKTTVDNFVKQKQSFEAAIGQGIPPQLAQVYQKGLRPLSQKSIAEMISKTQQYQQMGQNQPQKPGVQPNPANPAGLNLPGVKDNGDGTAKVFDPSKVKPNQNAKLPHDHPGVEPTDGVSPQKPQGTQQTQKPQADTSAQEKQMWDKIQKLNPTQMATLQKAFQNAIKQQPAMTKTQQTRVLYQLFKEATGAVAVPGDPAAALGPKRTRVRQPAAGPAAGPVSVNPAAAAPAAAPATAPVAKAPAAPIPPVATTPAAPAGQATEIGVDKAPKATTPKATKQPTAPKVQTPKPPKGNAAVVKGPDGAPAAATPTPTAVAPAATATPPAATPGVVQPPTDNKDPYELKPEPQVPPLQSMQQQWGKLKPDQKQNAMKAIMKALQDMEDEANGIIPLASSKKTLFKLA